MKNNIVVYVNALACMAFFIGFAVSKFDNWIYFIIALLFSVLMAMEINHLEIKELLKNNKRVRK